MEIRGKTYLSKGNYGFYMTVKDRNDAKVFLTVGFRRDQEPKEGGEFDIKNAFLSAYPTKSGDVKLKLVILDYEQVSESAAPNAPVREAAHAPLKSPSGEEYHPAVKFEQTGIGGKLPF